MPSQASAINPLSITNFPAYRPNWRVALFRGIFSVLFGVLAFAWPGATLLSVALVFGVYAFMDGILAFSHGVRRGAEHRAWGVAIFEGVVGIGIGLGTFFYPGLTALALVYLVAGWALVTGIAEIYAAVELHRHPHFKSIRGRTAVLAIAGIFSIVFGVFVVASPLAGAIALVTLLAGYAVVFGTLMIGWAIQLKRHQSILVTAGIQPKAA